GVVAVHLAETSRYISYSKELFEPFSLFCQKEHEFDFYLKKHPDQDIPDLSSCTQCGMVDYIENKIILNGAIEYERIGTDGVFVDIIESKREDNRIIVEMDERMDKITSVTHSGSLAHFYSGPFEVRIEDNTRYYNYHEYPGVPYLIERIAPNIVIDEQGSLKRTVTENTLTLYDPRKESGRRFMDQWNALMQKANDIKDNYQRLIERLVS
ncbi:hypothetical protein JXB31_03675, partial [Candidatus Woesearchaeota archaeon]|nr:hypothetical protein [Candidatus Woesearchaeota archaeon]